MIIKETIKTPSRSHLYREINKTIKIVDKFKNTKEVRSPAIKTNTSIKINKIEIAYTSKGCFLALATNKANNKGNNLDKYDPKISSFPKKEETL
jgi:hypothetical protein